MKFRAKKLFQGKQSKSGAMCLRITYHWWVPRGNTVFINNNWQHCACERYHSNESVTVDFHVIVTVNNELVKIRYHSDDEVKDATSEWCSLTRREFFNKEFVNLYKNMKSVRTCLAIVYKNIFFFLYYLIN